MLPEKDVAEFEQIFTQLWPVLSANKALLKRMEETRQHTIIVEALCSAVLDLVFYQYGVVVRVTWIDSHP